MEGTGALDKEGPRSEDITEDKHFNNPEEGEHVKEQVKCMMGQVKHEHFAKKVQRHRPS